MFAPDGVAVVFRAPKPDSVLQWARLCGLRSGSRDTVLDLCVHAGTKACSILLFKRGQRSSTRSTKTKTDFCEFVRVL